jgi:hypothetical protein
MLFRMRMPSNVAVVAAIWLSVAATTSQTPTGKNRKGCKYLPLNTR